MLKTFFTPAKGNLRNVWVGLLILLLVPNLNTRAQESGLLSNLTATIDSLDRKNDTTELAIAFHDGDRLIRQWGTQFSTEDILDFRMKETRYLVKYSKIAIDSGIRRYSELGAQAGELGLYEIETVSLGRIANAHRSKRQIGEAYEYNQKEIAAARRSENDNLIGRALITELDISYNSLPWPVQTEDLQELIKKGNEAIAFASEKELDEVRDFGKLYLSKFYIKQQEYRKADSILKGISDNAPLAIAFSKYEHLCELAKETNDLEAYRAYTLEFKWRAYETRRPFVALNAHNYLLDYSLRNKDEDSAKFYAEQLEANLAVVDTTKYLDFLDISYSTLASYYNGKDVGKERKYLSNSVAVNRTIASRQRAAFLAIEKYKSQVADLEEANSDLSKLNAFFKNNFITLLVVSVLFLILIVWLYRKYYSSQRKTAEVIEEKEHMAESVIRKHFELNNKQHVYLENLKYVKADKNYVEFHTEERRYVDRNKLSTVLDALPPNFIQVHRSYVINRNFIKTHDSRRIILFPSIEIPLSRTFKPHLQQVL